MENCCKPQDHQHQKRTTLWWVLIINALTFFIQFSASYFAHSTALLADSLDMLGDVFVYAISLYAMNRGGRWLAKAAFMKGVIIALFSLVVIVEAYHKYLEGILPSANLMIYFSLFGLMTNGACLFLLTRHRNSDINMRSTWLCSINDMIGNTSVLLAAGLVFWFQSNLPDILIGLLLSLVLAFSSFKIIKESILHFKNN